MRRCLSGRQGTETGAGESKEVRRGLGPPGLKAQSSASQPWMHNDTTEGASHTHTPTPGILPFLSGY